MILGATDAIVREAVDEHPQRTKGTDEDMRHEELGPDFEEEEGPVSMSPKPLLVLGDKLNDLALGEAHRIEVVAETVVDGIERSVLDQLVNLDIQLRSWVLRAVELPATEVRVEPAEKYVSRFGNHFGASGRVESENSSSRDQTEVLRLSASHHDCMRG